LPSLAARPHLNIYVYLFADDRTVKRFISTAENFTCKKRFLVRGDRYILHDCFSIRIAVPLSGNAAASKRGPFIDGSFGTIEA